VPTYLVTQEHGPGWDRSRSLREQDGWDRHATFMDQLVDEGFVLLGGPVGDGALLVIAAETEDAVRERLARDPWKPSGHLRTAAVERWQVLLGELPIPSR
jgi:hypothetical protein